MSVTRYASVVVLLLSSVAARGECRDPLFATDAAGAAVAGSKEALRRYVRGGAPLRVAWALDADREGKVDVTHWADAVFLTEFENELFTQVVEIRRQNPKRGTASIAIGPQPQQWRGLLGTNGVLEGAFSTGEEPHRFNVATWWCPVARPAECTPSWRLAYQHDTNGQPVAGSKDALFDAIRRGQPIRLSWGTAVPARKIAVEHAAEPVFVTIMNGSEVVAQLPEHIAQQSYWDAAQAKFENPGVLWRATMSTTGDFDAVWVHRGTGETVRRLPQKARVAWHVLAPDPACTTTPAPLLAVEGGVTLAKP